MKTMNSPLRGIKLGVLAAAMLSLCAVAAEELTAFKLIKEGDRYIGEQSKDKVVQMRSEKSIGSMSPNIWHIVYFDPTASLKAVEVKFGAGKMLSVKRPLRLLEPVTGAEAPLAQDKLKIDSDAAIATALKEPLLANLKPCATQLFLTRMPKDLLDQTSAGEAVWKVRLWAPKLRNTAKTADIGEVWISVFTGKVLRDNLHIDRVD